MTSIFTLWNLYITSFTAKEISPTEINEPSATSDAVLNDDVSEPTADITVDQEALTKLKAQQQKYKTAAVAWKKAGNKEQALQYVKTVKQFDIVIAAVAAGEKLDLSDMPPIPTLPSSADIVSPVIKEESEVQQQSSTDTGNIHNRQNFKKIIHIYYKNITNAVKNIALLICVFEMRKIKKIYTYKQWIKNIYILQLIFPNFSLCSIL